jgi:hypothetical protein
MYSQWSHCFHASHRHRVANNSYFVCTWQSYSCYYGVRNYIHSFFMQLHIHFRSIHEDCFFFLVFFFWSTPVCPIISLYTRVVCPSILKESSNSYQQWNDNIETITDTVRSVQLRVFPAACGEIHCFGGKEIAKPDRRKSSTLPSSRSLRNNEWREGHILDMQWCRL